jgi:hypothetical protein
MSDLAQLITNGFDRLEARMSSLEQLQEERIERVREDTARHGAQLLVIESKCCAHERFNAEVTTEVEEMKYLIQRAKGVWWVLGIMAGVVAFLTATTVSVLKLGR